MNFSDNIDTKLKKKLQFFFVFFMNFDCIIWKGRFAVCLRIFLKLYFV